MSRLWIIAAVVVLALFGIQAGLHLQAQDRSPRGFVEGMIENMLAAEGRTVSIDGLSISLTGNIGAQRVEVKDGEDAWIVIEGLNLDWQPLSLLRETLQVNSVSIDSIDFKRLPQSPDAGVSAPQEVGSLTSADINSLKIAKLQIGAGVMGEATTLKVDGSARIRQAPAEISFALTADRTDGKQGHLTAAIMLDPNDRRLNVDIALSEQADGFVASALNVAGDPSVDLTLKASGTIDNWSGDFAIDLDKMRTVAGKATMASDASGIRLEIDGGGELAALIPSGAAPFFQGTSQLVASVRFDQNARRADVQPLRLESEAFQLRASGQLDWGGGSSDFTVELRSKDEGQSVTVPDVPSLGSLTLTGLRADIHVAGALLTPQWTFAAAAATIASDKGVVQGADIRVTGIGIAPAVQPMTLSGIVKGELEQGPEGIIPPVLLGAIDADFAIGWEAGGNLAVDKFEIEVGAIELTAKGNANTGNGSFDIITTATTESPETGYALADRFLTGPVRFDGRVTGDGKGGFGVEKLQVTSSAAEAELNGKVDTVAVDVAVKATLSDLGLLHENMAGTAKFGATLKGPRAAPQAVVDASGEGVSLLSKAFERPTLSATFMLDSAKPNGEFALSGLLDGKQVKAEARIETQADGTRILRPLSARAGSAELSGELQLPSSGIATGHLEFVAPDLSDIAPFLLARLSGSARGTIKLEPGTGKGLALVDITGRDIQSDAFSARTLAAQFTVNSLMDQPRPEGKIALSRARIGGLAFTDLAVTATTTASNAFAVVARAAGNDLSVDAQANVELQGSNTVLTVTRFSGRTLGLPFQASRTFVVRKQGDAISVTDADLAIGRGRVTVNGQLAPQFDARLGLNDLPLSAFEKLAAAPGLAGTLSGQLELRGRPAALNGRFDVSGSGVSFEQLRSQGLRTLTFKANGTISNSRVNLRGTAQSGPDLNIAVDGDVGLTAPSTLNLHLRGRAGSRVFADRVADQGLRLDGRADFDLRVTGPAASPRVNGAINLAGATFGDAQGRFIVRNGSGRITVDGTTLRIASLEGTTGRNGRASISGTVALDQGPAVNVKAVIRNGIYADGTLVYTRYDADLTLAGSFAGTPLLSGRINLENTKITLNEIPPSAIPVVDVDHVHASRQVRKQVATLRRAGGGGTIPIALDIALRTDGPITVTGRGLNVLLGGRLQITGLVGEPVASGAFTLRRGSLKLLARRLEFESGRLDFDRDLDPRINLVAVSRRTDAVITLTIAGRASAPDISVTSVPKLPQEEALARLMFDRSMTNLSPLQIAQIASSIAVLSGGSSDSGLLTSLQNALGVDWVEVTETETGETAIGIGKRLNDKLSVGVEQATRSNTSRVTIDYDITKNLKARGAMGTDGSSRAGFVYEKDY